jgi:hypothetical protein
MADEDTDFPRGGGEILSPSERRALAEAAEDDAQAPSTGEKPAARKRKSDAAASTAGPSPKRPRGEDRAATLSQKVAHEKFYLHKPARLFLNVFFFSFFLSFFLGVRQTRHWRRA